MQEIISQTENGKIFRCSGCNQIHVEFNNLNFNFNDKEFQNFSDFIKQINDHYIEHQNKDAIYRRKIIIPLGYKNLNVLLNKNELFELKQLLNQNNQGFAKHIIIQAKDMNFTQFLN